MPRILIKEIYQGNRALFDGLWIADQWGWGKVHPVIHLSFASMGYRTMGLEAAIAAELQSGEFKLDKTAQVAIAQIKGRDYAGAFCNDQRPKVLVGINFSSKLKSVDDWVMETHLI